MFICINYDNEVIFNFLINLNINLYQMDKYQKSILFNSCVKQNLNFIEKIISKGYDLKNNTFV